MNELQAANVSALANNRTAGSGGFKVVAAGAVLTDVKFTSIIPEAAATFTVWKENDVDVLADRSAALAVAAGTYMPAPAGTYITAVTCDVQFIGYY